MLNWIRKLFKKPLYKTFKIYISKEDRNELEYYWESIYADGTKMYITRILRDDLVKPDYIFYTYSGLPFRVIYRDKKGIVKAKRYNK